MKKLRISESTGVSRNTLKKYIKTYLDLNLTPEIIDGCSDSELDQLFGENMPKEP